MNLISGQNIPLSTNSLKISLSIPQKPDHVSVDPCLFLLQSNEKIKTDDDFVFFNNPCRNDVGIALNNDVFTLQLTQVSNEISKIVLALTLTDAVSRNQSLADVNKVEMLITDNATQQIIAIFMIETHGMRETALIMGEVYLRNGQWKLKALGSSGFVGGLQPLAELYGVNIGAEASATPPADDAEQSEPFRLKSREEFRSFYGSELVPKLQQLEVKRKKLVSNIITTLISISVLTILIFVVTHTQGVIIGGVAIYLFIHFLWFDEKKKDITEEFKFEIIQNLVKFFDASLSYISTESISKTEYLESRLFLTSVDRYFGDDLVSGKLDKTSIKFSEVHTEHKHKSGENTEWRTIFRGIFLIADFNKNFNGRTVVLPDVAEAALGRSIGRALQRIDMTRDPLVILEDVEFEKLFCVHSTDQVEARYILSPKLMQRIVELKKKSGKKIHLSFINSKLFIAISIDKELFEPPFFTTLLNPKLIEEFFEYLYLSISIVEELDLNTRIWTKV